MIFKILKTPNMLSLFSLVLLSTACASKHNLVKDNRYSIKELHTSGIIITVKEMYVDVGTFIVSGKLTRLRPSISSPGHVDIAVVDRHGSVFSHVSVKNKLPFNVRSKRAFSFFKASFSTVPPDSSTVRVSFHKKVFLRDGQSDCGANTAAIKQTQI